jgi:hypothetical protein
MLLGPFPAHLREHVKRTGGLVPWPEHPIAKAVMLHSCSGFVCVLDEDGTMWIYDATASKMIAECPDSPEKLLQIKGATRHWPELADWLPRRPTAAVDCRRCLGEGYLLAPAFERPCSICKGLGWITNVPSGSSHTGEGNGP